MTQAYIIKEISISNHKDHIKKVTNKLHSITGKLHSTWKFRFGRKAMTNLDSILKSRDITLPTKVCLGKAMVFPVVVYGCESWTIKKAERQRIDTFELWWRRLLRVPWTARRCNQSILKEISPEYSLEGLMLKLKIQYFGHLIRRANSLEKTLESPLDCKEIKPTHPKGNQSWIFIGRTDAEVESPILWPPDAKN